MIHAEVCAGHTGRQRSAGSLRAARALENAQKSWFCLGEVRIGHIDVFSMSYLSNIFM